MIRLAVVGVSMCLWATFAGADAASDCRDGTGDIQIRGCSQIIKSKRLFGKPISKRNLANAYCSRGYAYFDKGQYVKAIADFTRALKLNPKFADAYYTRGVAHRRKRQYDKAIADYTRALKLNPKYTSVYYARGLVYENTGDRDKAIADFRKALELKPSYEDSKKALKRLGVTP